MNAIEWFEFIASYAIQVVFVIAIAAGLDRWTTSASVKARIWNTCFVSLLGMVAIGLLLPRLHLFHPWSALQPKALLMVFGNRAVEFRICPEDFAPFCYQFHQPTVFLPMSLLKSDPDTLEHVLYHELTHLRTQHPMQLFCQNFVQCLLWFHPLVWMSSNRAGLIREFVCDDASALHAKSTTAYLKALITVADETLKRTEGTLAIGQSKRELLTRVRRLAHTSPSQSARNGSAATVILVIAALLGSQIWLPTNPLATRRSNWSPWPSWSAEALHTLNVSVRDYEIFQHGNQLHEWIEEANEERVASAP